jgi:hypothetical protein
MASVGKSESPGSVLIGVECRTSGDSIFQFVGKGESGARDNRVKEACNRPAATRGASKRANNAPSSGQSLDSQLEHASR